MIQGIELNSIKGDITCDACIKSKIACKPLPKEPRDLTKKFGERIYSDVWGPSRHPTIDKKTYYVSFIDDYSRELVLYLMGAKSEGFTKYKLYEAMMCHQRGVHIKALIFRLQQEHELLMALSLDSKLKS
jgi:hypothetical protein